MSFVILSLRDENFPPFQMRRDHYLLVDVSFLKVKDENFPPFLMVRDHYKWYFCHKG